MSLRVGLLSCMCAGGGTGGPGGGRAGYGGREGGNQPIRGATGGSGADQGPGEPGASSRVLPRASLPGNPGFSEQTFSL